MSKRTDARQCALIVARAACSKKASDVVVQRVAEVLHETDYFVIVTASSRPMSEAIADEVRANLRETTGRVVLSVEGVRGDDWLLLDYGDFVVHIMRRETRDFYRIESVWNDAPFVDLAAEGIEVDPYSERIAHVVAGAGVDAPSGVR